MSKDKRLPEDEREREYLAALSDCPLEVKLLKLADLYDNLLDSSGLPVSLRKKKINKALEFLTLYENNVPPAWQHVPAAVREQVQIAQANL